jgi:hypothetical protein
MPVSKISTTQFGGGDRGESTQEMLHMFCRLSSVPWAWASKTWSRDLAFI